MGCNMSAYGLSSKNKQTVVHTMTTELNLTAEEKRLIRESWELFEPKKTAIGRKMFVK